MIEIVGVISYYSSNKNLNISFEPNIALKSIDFFTYTAKLIQGFTTGSWTAMQILGLGIVLLMVTPYLRVVASVIYFGFGKNPKYLVITMFVLIILTASLLAH